MFIKINQTSEIEQSLEQEHKVKLLDSDSDVEKITEIKMYMEEVRKDFQTKESNSYITASRVILNS